MDQLGADSHWTNFALNKCLIKFYKTAMDVYEEGRSMYENTT